MTEIANCCGCCKLKRAVLIIFILDCIQWIGFFITMISYVKRRHNIDDEMNKVYDYVSKKNLDLGDLTYDDIKGMLTSALDLLYAFPVVINVLVFMPRIYYFIRLKCSKNSLVMRFRAQRRRIIGIVLLFLL